MVPFFLLNTVFILLIDVKMLTIVDLLTSVSGMNFSNYFFFQAFVIPCSARLSVS